MLVRIDGLNSALPAPPPEHVKPLSTASVSMQAWFFEAAGWRMQAMPWSAQARLQSPSNALKNQRWLPPPQAGGGGGGGGDVGGGDGGGGVDGGEGGWNCTSKDSAPWLPLAKEKLCPKPGATHSFPNQPSKREFVISRVHVAPSATANGSLEAYGAPNGAAALSVVPSEQLRLQPTSLG